MAAPQVSSQFMDDMGPLAAMFAGRNQGLAENTEMTNQQNTLEQIANSQQTRDIAKQKLPFELAQLEHQQKMNPLLLEQQGTKNKSDLQKLDKDKFDTFFGQFKDTIPTLQGGPADVAVLTEVAKKNGMDPEDPRIKRMIETVGSGNKQAIDAMMKRIYEMSSTGQDTAAKEAAATARNTATNQTHRDVANISGQYSVQRAQVMAAAKANASSKMQTLLQITKGDPVKTKTALIQMGNEALKAGKNEEAEALFQQANDPALSALATNAQAQRAQTVLTPEGGLGSTGGTVPVPQAGPRKEAAPVARTPEDEKALAWAKANPADPRALEIQKRLGNK